MTLGSVGAGGELTIVQPAEAARATRVAGPAHRLADDRASAPAWRDRHFP
jgi:hypothetical protein